MKQLKILAVVAVLVFCGSAALGQTQDQVEGGDQPVDTAEIDTRLGKYIIHLQAARAFAHKISKASAANQQALVFRSDERNFTLMNEGDELAAEIAALPAESAAREQLEERLGAAIADSGIGIPQRLVELDQQIAAATDLSELEGVARIAAETGLNALTSVRFRYAQALAAHLETREYLRLPSAELRTSLTDSFYLEAESLAGHILMSSHAIDELQARLRMDPSNADLETSLHRVESAHRREVGQLDGLTDMMDSLGSDTSTYQALLLQQGGGVSMDLLEDRVLFDLLLDWVNRLRLLLLENSPDLLLKVLIFVLVLLVFRALARFTRKLVYSACERSSLDISQLLKDTMVSLSGGMVMILGVLMAVSQLGISLGPMLAGFGIAGFIVGFALQDTLANFAAGAMILIYRPYDVDDFVEVAGASGEVKKMNLVSTTITTFDNQTLVVPNNKIWGDVIKNVTAQKVRRVDLEFGIAYSDDIALAERVLQEVAAGHELVLKTPAPLIRLNSLGDSSVNLILRPWTKTPDYWTVYWDLLREVKLRFDAEGISIPFPQRDVHVIPAGAD